MVRTANYDSQNVTAKETVDAYLTAFAAGRVDDIISLLANDVVWHIDGDVAVSTVGLLQGPAQVRLWLEKFPQNFRPRVFSITDTLEHNGTVLVLGRFRHTVLSTGNTVGSDMVIHFTVSGGKITRYQIFEDSALLSRAFKADDEWPLQQVRINGTLYRYRDVGEGPTLIFAPGLCASHDAFSAQVQTLSESYRCIVLDMPGHGSSEHRANGWTTDAMIGDLALMIAELSLGSVIFICDAQDTATPDKLSREIAASIPDARLLMLAGTDHQLPTEAAQTLTAAIAEFIAAERAEHQ